MNEHRFDNKGALYAAARPAYSAALFALLQEGGLAGSDTVAADIGAGTGIFTADLAPLVKTVYAIEPNADMRRHIPAADNILPLDASAEHTSLSPCSIDLVAVAQAFHWFDRAAFRAECRRILKPHGVVLLVWNDRDATNEVIADNYAVNRRFCPAFHGASNGMDFEPAAFADFFTGTFETFELSNDQLYDRETFLARNLSSSYAPKAGDESYDAYITALCELFDKHNQNGILSYPYITRCYIGRV